MQDKRQGEDATEHAQAMARLQGQLAAAQDRAKKTDEEAARLRAAVKQLQDELSSQTALLHSQVTLHCRLSLDFLISMKLFHRH